MENLTDISTFSHAAGQCAELSTLQIAAGFVTWLNVLKILAIFVGTSCFLILFGQTIRRMISTFAGVPLFLYEASGYALSVALIIGANFADQKLQSWMIISGGLLVAGMIPLFNSLQDRKMNNTFYAALITILWASIAIYYNSDVAGFGTVIAFMSFMGFSVLVTPMAYAIGFDDENSTYRAGSAGLLICILLALDRYHFPTTETSTAIISGSFEVFKKGLEWLGPFVFGLSMLISSSFWFKKFTASEYLKRQIIAGICFFGLIMTGSILQIDTMLNAGTAFMILFILEKPLEISRKSITAMAVTGLVISSVIGYGVYWMQFNQDILTMWIPMLAQ